MTVVSDLDTDIRKDSYVDRDVSRDIQTEVKQLAAVCAHMRTKESIEAEQKERRSQDEGGHTPRPPGLLA